MALMQCLLDDCKNIFPAHFNQAILIMYWFAQPSLQRPGNTFLITFELYHSLADDGRCSILYHNDNLIKQFYDLWSKSIGDKRSSLKRTSKVLSQNLQLPSSEQCWKTILWQMVMVKVQSQSHHTHFQGMFVLEKCKKKLFHWLTWD